MTNFQVYKKTLSFSFVMFAFDLVGLAALAGLCVGGFFIGYAAGGAAAGIVGLIVGFILGAIAAWAISFFITNRYKAGQIAMMTKGVTEDKLPDHAFKAGKEEVKGRFGKIAVFFAITNAIKGIFKQLGRSINRIGTAIGGDVGNGITSAIDSAIQTLIAYLCDCCLGWVLYRKDENPWKAGFEGCAIFFKHGKTLIRNIGRIFGMGILSFIVIAGGFFGIFLAIFSAIPNSFSAIAKAMVELGADAEIFTEPLVFRIVAALFLGIILWTILHSILVRPFILVGVLRNFMAAGKEHIPTEAEIAALESKSPKFAKLRNKMQSE